MSKKLNEDEEIILIAKMYTGEYIEDNIGHEIINFFKPDNKDCYYGYIIYNGKVNNCKKIKSILFVSNIKDKKVRVIAKVDKPNFISDTESNLEKQETYIINNDIKYGGVLLNEIMKNNGGTTADSIFITYKAENIMELKEEKYILLKDSQENESKANIKTSWNIGHNMGYISSIKNKEDYNKLKELINKQTEWKPINTRTINEEIINKYSDLYDNIDGFMDIIGKYYDETAFSNMLYYYFNKKKMLKNFAENVLGINNLSENAHIEKEKATKTDSQKGRIDLWIEDQDNKYCVVIENKIKSGINGKHIEDDKDIGKEIEKSQLDKYRDWVDGEEDDKESNYEKYKDYEKKYYIFAPNYKLDELKKDIKENNLMPKKEDGSDLYDIITYKKIFDYFNREEVKEKMKNDKYYIGFLKALSKHIYNDEKEMERKFVCAINNANKDKK